MPIYERAPVECQDIGARMMDKYHGELRDAGVTIDYLFAKKKPDSNGEIDPEVHALKLHGYPVAAMVRANSYKNRVLGHSDAEIIIDGDRWDEWSAEEKDALIDHEIEHLELKTDKDGLLRRDDLDRPMLRVKLHDHEFGWFDSIARRHGKHSFEVQQYEKFREAHRQTWLNFRDEHETTVTFSAIPISKLKTLKQDMRGEMKKRGILAAGKKGSTRRAASKR